MSDIQHYDDGGYKHDYGDWIKAKDFSLYKERNNDKHAKEIKAKDKEIERLKEALNYSLTLNENLKGHVGDELKKVDKFWELLK